MVFGFIIESPTSMFNFKTCALLLTNTKIIQAFSKKILKWFYRIEGKHSRPTVFSRGRKTIRGKGRQGQGPTLKKKNRK